MCVEYGQFRMVWIGVPGENGALTPAAWAGDDALFVHRSGSPDKNPCAQAIRTRRSCVRNDLDEGAPPCSALCAYRSACAVPLHLPEDVIGVLAFYSSEPSFFDEEEVRLLEDVTSDLSFAAEAIHAEQRRRRAEQTLRATHRRLEIIFSASPVAIIAMDAQGTVTAWNRAAEQVFGWTAAEVIGAKCPLFVP